jgi:Mg2+/Co2+ transporter CorB
MLFALNWKFPTEENNYITGKVLHKTVVVPQPIQQTICHHIPEQEHS